MKLWSRGLGKTELNMDFRYYRVATDKSSEDVYVIGKITDPVDWEFKITMGPDDMAGLIKIALSWSVIRLALKNFYRYIVFLFKRSEYEKEIDRDLEAKVNDAYISMMKGRQRRTLTRMSNDSFNGSMQASMLE